MTKDGNEDGDDDHNHGHDDDRHYHYHDDQHCKVLSPYEVF